MTAAEEYADAGTVVVAASADALYDLVSDVTRTGEWSPICTACWWDEPSAAGVVGAWFTGRNVLPQRTWETRSRVVLADRGREFAFEVGKGYVRWSFTMEPSAEGTALTESWHFLPAGVAMFHEKYAEAAPHEIGARTEAAHTGIPLTLAALKRIAESS